MKVELKQIDKAFGPVRANQEITLTWHGGGIYGLLGENGAGKSTLMKVLSGYNRADRGEIWLDGQRCQFHSPADALRHGVGMLHQDPLDILPMRLLENFLTGGDGMLLDEKSAEAAFVALNRQFDFDLNPNAFVHELTVGERQQLEIIRLLWKGARVLILDEPTTGISAPQKIKLFATLRQLAQQGKTILLVSHKLEDVEALCQQIAVLRQGRVVLQQVAPFDFDEVVGAMFGQLLAPSPRPFAPIGPTLLALENLILLHNDQPMGPIQLKLAAGEVMGVAGLEGSGQRPLMLACAGLHPIQAGSLKLNGQESKGHGYHHYVKAGVAFLPANRLAEGLIPGLTIAEHLALAQHAQLPRHRRRAKINWPSIEKKAREEIVSFNIHGVPDSTVESLSGGNQQRTLLSLLPPKLRLLIMEHPTRGLDVESAAYIWGKLLTRRGDGTAILFASADLDELCQYSDRIIVCCGGQITAIVPTTTTSVEELGYLIAGKTPQD